MRQRIAVGAAALVIASGATASAKVFVFPRLDQTSYGYQLREYRPRTINLPADLKAVDIRWTGWGSKRAVGVGHVIDEPRNQLRFTATMITSDARAVDKCIVRRPPVVRYYRHLYIRALTPALEQDDEVSGNFAAHPTTEC
jgi:hypothetical protein